MGESNAGQTSGEESASPQQAGPDVVWEGEPEKKDAKPGVVWEGEPEK